MVSVEGGLIGRDAELARLRALVGEVASGRGGSVWVDGEPGIGKTALLAAGLESAQAAGCQLFMARADESSEIFPLRVLLDALQVGPQSAEPGRAEIAERLWRRQATSTITPGDSVAAAAELLLILVDRLCAAGPVVLAVDDLQWADEMSLAVWGRLGRAVAQLPLLLVAAARPVPQRGQLDRLRRHLTTDGQVELILGPLGPSQAQTLARRLAATPPGPELQDLVRQAGGNPLYIREIVELVERSAARPLSLAAAIGARLTFLSRTATRVLRLATLLGVEFRIEHLTTLTRHPATTLMGAIEEALVAGVLTERGSTLAFRHGLIHQALYESMPGPLRDGLHQQAAQVLAEAGAPVEAVAGQLAAAPQVQADWTVNWLVEAARTLTSRAPQVALDLLQRMNHTIERTDPRRAVLEMHLIETKIQLGRNDEVEELSRPLLAATRDPELAGRVSWALAYALRSLGQFEPALAVTGHAITERHVTERWKARLRALHASMLYRTGRPDDALDAAEQAAIEGQRAGDTFAVAWALFASSLVRGGHHQDNPAALTMMERAADLLGDEAEATDLRLLLLAGRVTTLWNMGRQPEANRLMGQALALAERAGTPVRLATLRVQAAENCFLEGRWDDALAELEAATDLPPQSPTRLMLNGLAALIAVHRDDEAAIGTYIRSGDGAEIPIGYVSFADNLLAARALADERDGRAEQALALLLEALDPQSTRLFPQLTPDTCLWLPDAVRLALAVGDKAVARAAAEACSAEADRHRLPVAVAAADRCRGLVDDDTAALMSAADAFHRIAYPLFRALALEDAAVLLAQRGDAVRARAAYSDARGIFSDLEATWDIRRIDARLRPLGIRSGVRGPRHRPRIGWEALTPTEAKIAQLVAAGKSNPDIAAELYLSRHTVQTHVSHILTKLECRSRIEVAIQTINATAGTDHVGAPKA